MRKQLKKEGDRLKQAKLFDKMATGPIGKVRDVMKTLTSTVEGAGQSIGAFAETAVEGAASVAAIAAAMVTATAFAWKMSEPFVKGAKGRMPSVPVDEIKRLSKEGFGATAIAKRLGVGRASIYRALGGQTQI